LCYTVRAARSPSFGYSPGYITPAAASASRARAS